MTDLNTSPHSPEKQREQRLYEAAQKVSRAWHSYCAGDVRAYKVGLAVLALETALDAYDGKAV